MLFKKNQTQEAGLEQQYHDLIAKGAAKIDGSSVVLQEVGELGTWPRTNDAIVKFQYRDLEQPYAEIDGIQQANLVDIYCQVADWTEHQIIDPTDDEVKEPGHYGSPTGWVSYLPSKDPASPDPKKNEEKNAYNYIVGEGETVWWIAHKLHIPVQELIQGNGLEDDPNDLPAGSVLLVHPKNREEQPLIEYEILPSPRLMHVSKEGGAKKMSFGHAINWSDIKPTGPTYAEYTNVEILAIAHVPVKDGGKEITVAYMLDSLALGNYKETGRVTYTVGFNHTHLSDGHVERPKRKPAAPVAERINTATDEDIKIAVTKAPAINLTPNYNEWKTTQKPLNEQRIARTFLCNPGKDENGNQLSAIMVHDLDGKRPSRPLYRHQGVKIFSTFWKDGIQYGRPAGSVDNGNWFGIPMDQLIDEDELYNTQLDLPTKVAIHGSLTLQERGVVTLSKVLSQGTKVAAIFKNKNNKKE